MTDDPSSRAISPTKRERRAALRARLAGDGETEGPPPALEPVDPVDDASPPPPRSPITQGARTPGPGQGEPDVSAWIRARARERGGGGIWTVP